MTIYLDSNLFPKFLEIVFIHRSVFKFHVRTIKRNFFQTLDNLKIPTNFIKLIELFSIFDHKNVENISAIVIFAKLEFRTDACFEKIY